MIKILGAASLVQYLERSALDLPEKKTRIVVTPEDPEEPISFGRIRLQGEASAFSEGEIVMFTTGRPGSRLEFQDMLKTGEVLYLLRDGDVLGTYTDAPA